jgi:hypothetical protein
MPPKQRSNTPNPAAGRSKLVLLLVAASGLVILAAVLGFILLGGGGSTASDAPKLFTAAGCTFQTVKAQKSSDHSILTPEGTSKQWNTSPPTSGAHYQAAAIWGAYTEPLQQAQIVHNLEHGGIFIQYGSNVPQTTVDELKRFYDKHLNGTLLSPLPSLGSKIALGAWVTPSASQADNGVAHLAKCTRFDKAAYAAFFDAYQFRGPERFSEKSMTPGA